jgi:hypothetical protein
MFLIVSLFSGGGGDEIPHNAKHAKQAGSGTTQSGTHPAKHAVHAGPVKMQEDPKVNSNEISRRIFIIIKIIS